MLYLEYEFYRLKYVETQQKFDELLSEKETLFARTQPKAVNYDGDHVSGGNATNKFEEYIEAKDRKRIDERLAEIKSILEDRERLLRLKEKELRASEDIRDKVFYMRYIDRMRIYKIANICHYSEMQIYRILHIINDSLKHDRKC